MYKPPEGTGHTQLPDVIFNVKDVTLSYITTFMRLFGVGRITRKPTHVGIKTLEDVSFKALPGNPPEEFAKSRSFMLRNLADMMMLFGVLDVEIVPNDEEQKIIEETWEALKSGTRPIPGVMAAPAQEDNIQLNVEADPTGESVLDEREEKEEAGECEEKDVDGSVEADAAEEQPGADTTTEKAE